MIQQTEKQLLNQFIASNEITGDWSFQVSLPKGNKEFFSGRQINSRKLNNIVAFRIDAICRAYNNLYIVEVKQKLKMEALGQLLCYKEMWEKRYPQVTNKIFLVCVFRETETMLEPVFKKYKVILCQL